MTEPVRTSCPTVTEALTKAAVLLDNAQDETDRQLMDLLPQIADRWISIAAVIQQGSD